MAERFCVGCAGWTIPKRCAVGFPAAGSHLARYAQRLCAVEINSSFQRPHRRATYERWSAGVPGDFRFAVKLPRTITHELRLMGADAALDAFLSAASGLGGRLGPLLVQLPPSLAFLAPVADAFFAALRRRFDGGVVCEPRHPGWFSPGAEALLAEWRVSRAGADPAVVAEAAAPGGWRGLAYFRLHGAPRVYYSSYAAEELERLAQRLRRQGAESHSVWCIFDNTAAGAATANALALQQRLGA